MQINHAYCQTVTGVSSYALLSVQPQHQYDKLTTSTVTNAKSLLMTYYLCSKKVKVISDSAAGPGA